MTLVIAPTSLFLPSSLLLMSFLQIGVSHHTVEANSGVQSFMTLKVQFGVEKKISGYLRITPFDSNSIEVTIADPKTWQPISCNTEGRNLILQCINFEDGIFIYFYTVNVSIVLWLTRKQE